MHWSHCHSGNRSLTPISPVPISVVTTNLTTNHHHLPWPSSFGNTCNRQRAPLAATTGLLRNNSEQTNWRDANTIRFPIDPAPGQGPGLHCCFCIACKIFQMRYHPQFDMSCHGSFDAHDNHNLDTYHGHDSWPECKVAFVVCGDKHIGCNFLTRLITPVLKKKKNCHHSSLDWVFGNEFGQGWCDRETMLVVVENTWSGNTIPLPWKENIWNGQM